MELCIASYNVRGLGMFQKRRQVFHYLHDKPYDIVFLQETHSTKKDEKRWNMEWSSKIYYSHGTSQARGVAILIKKKLGIKVQFIQKDDNGRYINLKIQYAHDDYVLSNVYGPNIDDPVFFHHFIDDIKELNTDLKIIGGDFNLILDPLLDRGGYTSCQCQHIHCNKSIYG